MDPSRHDPRAAAQSRRGHAPPANHEAARKALIDALKAEPAMDRRRVETGLLDVMDAFDDLFSVAQVRLSGATALVIGELAKAGRWDDVSTEVDRFYADQIAAARDTSGRLLAKASA